jgi:hypothetical protein
MKFPNSRTFFLIENCGPLCAGKDVFAAQAPAKKGPQLREKSRSPGGAIIRIGSTRLMKLHAVRAYFISTPQLASPQQKLLAGALYSRLFKRSFKPH